MDLGIIKDIKVVLLLSAVTHTYVGITKDRLDRKSVV